MRALQHCDFCGADAVGTFEIVPSELEPTEAEQRRVVLCGDCGDRLEDLLEPLLARAGIRAEPAGDDETTDGGGTVGAATGDSPAVRERAGSPNATDSATAEAADAEDGIILERDEREGRDDATADSSDAAPESAASTAGSARATDSSAGAPKAYGKVVRLLRNREFPMQRRAVSGLAAGAYDLESHEVDAVIDHAIEQGEFREDGNELYRA